MASAGITSEAESMTELSSPGFDYYIWMFVGLPFLFAGFLLLMLVTGGLSIR